MAMVRTPASRASRASSVVTALPPELDAMTSTSPAAIGWSSRSAGARPGRRSSAVLSGALAWSIRPSNRIGRTPHQAAGAVEQLLGQHVGVAGAEGVDRVTARDGFDHERQRPHRCAGHSRSPAVRRAPPRGRGTGDRQMLRGRSRGRTWVRHVRLQGRPSAVVHSRTGTVRSIVRVAQEVPRITDERCHSGAANPHVTVTPPLETGSARTMTSTSGGVKSNVIGHGTVVGSGGALACGGAPDPASGAPRSPGCLPRVPVDRGHRAGTDQRCSGILTCSVMSMSARTSWGSRARSWSWRMRQGSRDTC